MPTCINHPYVELTAPCAGCGRPHCDSCLVDLMGRRLCFQCKAEAIQGITATRQRHPLASVAVAVPVVGYVFCLTLITSPIGLYLGWKVLQDLRTQTHLSGRSAALAAIVLSAGSLGVWLVGLVASLIVLRLGFR